MKLLIYPELSEHDVGRIREAFPELTILCPRSEGEALAYIVDADVFYGRITLSLFMTAQRLKWVQADCIGLENYLFPELVESDIAVTNVRGVFSDHIANQVWAYILSFARDLPYYMRRQIAHDWRPGGRIVHLAECTIGIVGLGGIGREVAVRAPGFDCRVIAVDPRPQMPPEPVEAVWPPERLHDLLSLSDFVVICAPHAPGTERMFSTAEFAAMKPSAFLINIGRGVIVDLNALTQALHERRIAGAALDVYEMEPLPADHPLWDVENVILTPHIAGHGPYVQDRRIEVFIENMKRFIKGEPMWTVVDKNQWF
ncbi:MAG: D-2-hydroxyacid dehydrogenase [candidate division Zixibacteria bacterium]|nr:D-2-hydroxyacid dehydrogenase [candidate division Zixibacteria bacterium]